MEPYTVTAADFNDDGHLDLAIASDLDRVAILLGNGHGKLRKASGNLAGSDSIATGDFNGDGRLDLAVSDYNPDAGDGEVSILLGNGDGIFQPEIFFRAAPRDLDIATADFNGDGKLDLAVVSQIGPVCILLGNGDGTFQAQKQFPTRANGPGPLAVGDFNQDGRLDLAVGATGFGSSGGVSILPGNGDGSFQSPMSFATGLTPYSVVTADFDGDGKLDLATANMGSSSVSVLLGLGDGTFKPQTQYASGQQPVVVIAADLDADGKLDLVTADLLGAPVSILLGKGNGTFQKRLGFGEQGRPWGLVAGDFNEDGRLDLAITDLEAYKIRTLLQTGSEPQR